MANNHKFVVKNGLQTQNISFVDSDQNNTIFARMLSNDALAFSGNAGQLFSISDSLSGTIFAVNDISGVPSIEVDDDGEIRFAETFGHVLFGTDSSLDTSKYIVQVNGGIHADSITVNSITAVGGTFTGDLNLTANLDMQDNDKILIGNSDDLQLYHNGSNSFISNYGGNFYIDQNKNDGELYIRNDDGSGGVTPYFRAKGSTGEAFMHYYGTEKLKTQNTGVDVTGLITTDDLEVSDSAHITGNLTVGGNFTVSGTTTTVNTETINLADNNIVLNSNHSGAPSQNAGITVNRGSSTDKVFQWNETSDYWEFDDNIYATGGTSNHRLETSGGTATLELRPESTHTGWHPNLLLRSQNNGSVIYMLTNGNSLAIGSYNGGVPSDPSDFITFKSSTNDTPEIEIGDAGSTTSTLGLGAQDIVGTSTGVGFGVTDPATEVEVLDTLRVRGSVSGQHALMLEARADYFNDGNRAGIWISDGNAVGAFPSEGAHLVIEGRKNSSRDIYIKAGNTTSPQHVFYRDGNVGIGDLTPSYKLDVNGTGRFTGDLTVGGGNVYSDTSSQRVKYHTYSTVGSYGMGMMDDVTFGGMSNWAVTFSMNNQDNRGFWWGDDAHTKAQGAMALTSNGKLTVAHSARIGYGETDTTIPGASYTLDITGGIVTDTIEFDSATFSGTTIALRTIDSDGTQVSALSFEGDAGQLFSIVDSMGGTIFSVNDISGIPSIEVDDDGEIRLAEFNGHVLVGYASAPQSTSTYPLQVDGGIYANGTINGTFSGNGSSITSINASNISSGTISDARLPATISSDITGNAATATTATSATTATNVTATANNSTNETVYLTFVDGTTGSQGIETDTSLTYNPSTNLLAIASNTDISAEIGRAHIGYIGYGDMAGFSHIDLNSTTSYALLQYSTGNTYLNAPSGTSVFLRNNNNTIATVNNESLFVEDGKSLAAGSSQDLLLLHSSGNSAINNFTGDLSITNFATDKDVVIKTDDGTGGINTTDYFRADGSTGEAILYHYGSEKLKTQSTGVSVTGLLSATTKSFIIDHPTKPNHKLRYGSLEGPENGVYVRGRLKGNNTIELPEYWKELVHEDSITVELTPIGKHQKLYVEDFDNTKVIVGNDNLMSKEINCFYTVYGERKDVDKLEVEYEG